tara:strand:- start:19 stop:348 length:330 start_codon:yes stop_codon:yes gene_type:complete
MSQLEQVKEMIKREKYEGIILDAFVNAKRKKRLMLMDSLYINKDVFDYIKNHCIKVNSSGLEVYSYFYIKELEKKKRVYLVSHKYLEQDLYIIIIHNYYLRLEPLIETE